MRPAGVAADTFCLDTLRGTQRTSVPQIPFLEKFVTPEPPLSTLGFDLGSNLSGDDFGLSSDLVAMLQPDRKYLIAHTVSAGLSAQLPGLDFRASRSTPWVFADALEKRVFGEEARALVGRMRSPATALREMFDALIDLSRLEQDAVQPAIGSLDLDALLERLANEADCARCSRNGALSPCWQPPPKKPSRASIRTVHPSS